MKRGLLIVTFISVIILGALHQMGSAFYLYWDLPWFDSLMHFLGGFSVGMLFIWSWYGSDMFKRRVMPARASTVLQVMLFVLLVSTAWELFEYYFDIANPIGGNYPLDTFNDYTADMLGALVSGVIGTIKKFHE